MSPTASCGGNIFAQLPGRPAEEEFTDLLARPGALIERIVSAGHASPAGFWYDQGWDEWILLLSGAAALRFEAEEETRTLKPGDYLLIPARTRHRVEWTDPGRPTVWLAVHIGEVTAS
jgi:cupin 2 domain-containing protein